MRRLQVVFPSLSVTGLAAAAMDHAAAFTSSCRLAVWSVLLLAAVSLLVPASGQLDEEEGAPKVWENPCGTLQVAVYPEQLRPMHVPWVARIGYDVSGRMQFLCAGSLIDRNHVLTAAHCAKPGNLPTRVQLRNCDSSRKCDGAARNYGVAKVVPHPEYSSLSTSHLHDLAVIRLDRDVNLSTGNTSAVCMPMNKLKPGRLGEEALVVAGWRIHKKGTKVAPGGGALRTQVVPVVTTERCQKFYEGVFTIDPSLHICAGGEGNEPCKGDAGAPLHALVGKRVVQVGLVSLGLPECSNSSLPTVYTSVRPHIRWIQEVVADVY